MVDRTPTGGAPDGRGLERWLMRTLQGGLFRGLPRYYPLGDRAGRPPEQYARELLASLRDRGGDTYAQERARDDGRAFRSWAESRPVTTGNGGGRAWSAC